jgi:effector-binding domain-containing protein
MIDEPIITRSSEQQAAVIHVTTPRSEIEQVMDKAVAELLAGVMAQGMSPSGPLFAHHVKTDPKVFDFELGFPVPRPVAPSGKVKPGKLPAARVARTVYHGPYEGLYGAWTEFNEWVKEQGLKTAPDLWEVYESGPESSSDPADWRTQLNRPLLG